MAASKGSLMLIKKGNADGPPETFSTLAGVRSKSLVLGSSRLDTTTADDVDASGVTWQTFMPGLAEGSLDVEGVAKDTSIQGLVTDSLEGNARNYQVVVPNWGTLEGSMTISNFRFEGPYDGIVTFSMQMNLAAAPTVTLEGA